MQEKVHRFQQSLLQKKASAEEKRPPLVKAVSFPYLSEPFMNSAWGNPVVESSIDFDQAWDYPDPSAESEPESEWINFVSAKETHLIL